MLNLNQAVSSAAGTANEDVYKILIYDRFCQDILSPLIHVKDLRKHGVTLYFSLIRIAIPSTTSQLSTSSSPLLQMCSASSPTPLKPSTTLSTSISPPPYPGLSLRT
ncbi:UNVERIFIED_CONTAM: SEC1 family transport protein SLY1 [Sesamum radiatum]|uniref:SEC1 family transport protein SLY1 n=1 Tax=Sesamum radiatum TaxID=300843 RepID=A0AAW2MT35_SESRA